MQLYNPFYNLHFDNYTCFLSGNDIRLKDKLSVFPEWFMEHYGLADKRLRMMDKINEVAYKDLTLPCSPEVKEKFDALEIEVKTAFTQGYEAMKALDSHKLFIWMGKIVYGILYHDLCIEQKIKERQGSEFQLADALKERYSIFHLFLQSFISPIQFIGDRKPWTISIVQLDYSKDICNYRDDAVNMIFTLGTQKLGLIGCLLDNETVVKEYQPLLNKINDTKLHAIQFEELCAKFQYSSYLLDYKPTYRIHKIGDVFEVETLPLEFDGQTPIFAPWNDDTFATVLEGYFKPWGLTKKEIHHPPNAPISYLENEVDYSFIKPETITLQS